VVKIGGCPAEVYVDAVPAHIKVLNMKRLMNISHELDADLVSWVFFRSSPDGK
jgi:hypothetical protein